MSICRGLPLPQGAIAIHGRTNQIFQGALIDFVPLFQIDRSPFIASEAGVEELVRIWKACALRKGHFYFIFVGVGHTDESVVRPTRRAHPFPFLNDLGISIKNDFAKIGKHFAAPVRKACEQLVDKLGWV